MDQMTTACGLAALTRVIWAVMSTSFCPNFSFAATVRPAFCAAFSNSIQPSWPKA